MATLSQGSLTVQEQPQISLTVDPIITTTVSVLPQTQLLTTTEASSTDVLATEAAITQPPTTTRETSIIDVTTTEAGTTPPTTTGTSTNVTTETTYYDTPYTFGSTAEMPTNTETNVQMTEQATSTTNTLDNFVSDSHTEILDGNSNSVEARNSNTNLGLIVGSAIGGVVGIILLSLVAILTLIVVYQSRNYKKKLRDREAMNGVPQNISALDGIETKANLSYIPIFRQISTGDNVAYGEMANQDSSGLYETIDPSIEDSTTQLTSHTEQNKEDNTEYDYVN